MKLVRDIEIVQTGDCWQGQFSAMAGPCQILVDADAGSQAESLVQIAANEAWRIEQKFSRYRDDNIVFKINNANGRCVQIDHETKNLLNYADQCYRLSGGLFDITSGALRRAWKFDGGSTVPSKSQIARTLSLVGWNKVEHTADKVSMPTGMEIDFGGICKEYAADAALGLMVKTASVPVLVNFGGDLVCNSPRIGGEPWKVGIERPGDAESAVRVLSLRHGALATSGDARRFLFHKGKRLSHVLNPNTGWPVKDTASSVTVAARHCTEAGMLATFALLHGENAELFLNAQHVEHWVIRD